MKTRRAIRILYVCSLWTPRCLCSGSKEGGLRPINLACTCPTLQQHPTTIGIHGTGILTYICDWCWWELVDKCIPLPYILKPIGILLPQSSGLAFSLKDVAKDLSNSQARAARDVKEFLEVSLTCLPPHKELRLQLETVSGTKNNGPHMGVHFNGWLTWVLYMFNLLKPLIDRIHTRKYNYIYTWIYNFHLCRGAATLDVQSSTIFNLLNQRAPPCQSPESKVFRKWDRLTFEEIGSLDPKYYGVSYVFGLPLLWQYDWFLGFLGDWHLVSFGMTRLTRCRSGSEWMPICQQQCFLLVCD